MGDTFTIEQYKFFLESCIEEVNRCSASGSIRQPVAEKRPSYQISGVKELLVPLMELLYMLLFCLINRMYTEQDEEVTVIGMHTRGFMAPYRNVSTFSNIKEYAQIPLVKQRDITIACFAIHNFIRKEGLSDDFFAQYDQSDIHINENVRDDNDGDVEVAEPIGSEADQQYMINLRDDSALQIMQASQRWADILLLTRRRRPPLTPIFRRLHLYMPLSPPLFPLSLLKSVMFSISERFKHGSSLKASPLLYPKLCHMLFEKCSASGSIRRPVAEKRPYYQIFGVKELLVPLMELLYMLLFRLINRIYTEQEEEPPPTTSRPHLPSSPPQYAVVSTSVLHRIHLKPSSSPSLRHTRGFMAPYRNARYWLGDFFRKRAMTSKEKFNHAHAKHRNVIERAFGVLKARFPILKNGDETISLAPVVSANEELMKLKQGVASLLEVPKGKNINELADDAR
ncbi:hypothetical protein Tco_1016741, partial [Tanacetum coccineum]